jgi:hypothetical protein
VRACASLLLAVLALGAAPAAAQELGRLFLTPEQRSVLDARRKARVPDKPPAVEAVVDSPVTRLDGYVRRSGGRSTVWLNGVPTPEGVQAEGLQVRPGRSPASVWLTLGEEERRFELRVGEKLDRDSGEVRDVLGEDAIRVGRPPAQPR